MKTKIVTALLSIVLGLAAGWLLFRPSAGQPGTEGRTVLYYRDPMNPAHTSPVPKKAPDGMDFVPVYAEEGEGSRGRKIAYYRDPMHPWFTSETPGKAPDCGMDLVPVYEGEDEAEGIRIDPVTVQNIGVRTEEVKVRDLKKVIRTVGKVQPDETRISSVTTKIMGWVESLHVNYTGRPVRKGEPLLGIYSPELVSTQEEYLQALRYEKRLQESSVGEVRAAGEGLVESARRRLRYWDIPESEIAALERRGTPAKTMTLFSPVSGYVMEKAVFDGQSVTAGMELYRIADLSTVWVIADIFQYELSWVEVGHRADIELSYLPGKTFRGTVSYIYPMLNMETKTVRVRVEIRNTPALELRPEMFVTVRIVSPAAARVVAVPEQAIIRSGERNIAVIALGGGYFDPREVKLGVAAGGYVRILEGIREGEKIVVSSQFLIDSESNLKAAIGAMSGHAAHDKSIQKNDTAPPARPEGVEPRKDPGVSGQEGHGMHGEQRPPAEESTGRSGMQPDAGGRPDHPGGKDPDAGSTIDPVCGMDTGGDTRFSVVRNGRTYTFCSAHDMETFNRDPDRYVK